MKNLKIYCMCLEDHHFDNVKALGYIPVGLGKNNFLIKSTLSQPLGLRRRLGKLVYCQRYRGFESHSLRH